VFFDSNCGKQAFSLDLLVVFIYLREKKTSNFLEIVWEDLKSSDFRSRSLAR